MEKKGGLMITQTYYYCDTSLKLTDFCSRQQVPELMYHCSQIDGPVVHIEADTTIDASFS